MAAPRVFISSTCFDLGEIRDGLLAFLDDFGMEVALSERGDVFYHPDLHTHEACVLETSSCHLFVLIIGGRFGGQYVADKNRSITNAEYAAARSAGTPVFTFIKQDVLNDHNLWLKNKTKKFARRITYPSIERQEHAADIFNFIDDVRKSDVNNGFFGFRYGREVEMFLRKQLAGMIFDHLQKRTLSRQLSKNTEVVSNLSIVSSKIEELVKEIYRKVDVADAEGRITTIDQFGSAEGFFAAIATKCDDKLFLSTSDTDDALAADRVEWIDFLAQCAYFDVERDLNGNPERLVYNIFDEVPIGRFRDRSKWEQHEFDSLQLGYDAFRALSEEDKKRIVYRYTFVKRAE